DPRTLLDRLYFRRRRSPYAVAGRELVRTTLPALPWLHRQPEALFPHKGVAGGKPRSFGFCEKLLIGSIAYLPGSSIASTNGNEFTNGYVASFPVLSQKLRFKNQVKKPRTSSRTSGYRMGPIQRKCRYLKR